MYHSFQLIQDTIEKFFVKKSKATLAENQSESNGENIPDQANACEQPCTSSDAKSDKGDIELVTDSIYSIWFKKILFYSHFRFNRYP